MSTESCKELWIILIEDILLCFNSDNKTIGLIGKKENNII
jgi:hypothetical protein